MSQILKQFKSVQDLGIFIVPEHSLPHKTPLIIALLDASGSMSKAWPYMKKFFKQLVNTFKTRYGSLDSFLVIPFNENLHEEKSKCLKDHHNYPGHHTERFYQAFGFADQIIAAQPLDQQTPAINIPQVV